VLSWAANTSVRWLSFGWGGREARRAATPQNNRLSRVFEALTDLDVSAVPTVYTDEIVDEMREQLLEVDGVLVWVNPITEGRDRSKLDALLREVAGRGVWMSAHPDVILKMGTKQVIFDTRIRPSRSASLRA
jgi:hypothetical protein